MVGSPNTCVLTSSAGGAAGSHPPLCLVGEGAGEGAGEGIGEGAGEGTGERAGEGDEEKRWMRGE